MNCPNCLSLTTEVAEIRTIVERLDHELLGNGQPGRLKEQDNKIEAQRSQIEGLKISCAKAVDDKIELQRAQIEGLKISRAKAIGVLMLVGPLWTAVVAVLCVFLAAKLKAGN